METEAMEKRLRLTSELMKKKGEYEEAGMLDLWHQQMKSINS
jgi:hypothetical protein